MKEENLHIGHRKRMKDIFIKEGLANFSTIEKLEFLLYFAIPQKDVNPISHALLDEFKTLDNVLRAPIHALKNVKGVGEHTALLIATVFAFISEYGKCQLDHHLNKTSSSKSFAKNLYRGKVNEELTVIALSQKNDCINYKSFVIDQSCSVPVPIRKITAFALSCRCSNIMLIHNHNHSSSHPSADDLNYTKKIIESGIFNKLMVIDHLIVGDDGVYSFQEHGLIKDLYSSSLKSLKFNNAIAFPLEQLTAHYKIDT